MTTINLMPYFASNIGTRMSNGKAIKKNTDSSRPSTMRYFNLLVIAVDDESNTVFFEGWSSEAINTSKNRYHGTTSVCLEGLKSIVEVQMIGASQLPYVFNEFEYTS